MKNRKKKIGFTLIELLAVIIVLAIIALIATPIIFNVIENAKLKSLENSCYGVIDAVRTKYAEGLLNSEDGTVKLSGDVKDITVAGEQPIAGTWEIDNSSDSSNRGIKIKDVKFASMKDYTCTNVNSDGTINSKVTCTKGGSDALVETDLSCFEYEDILDYDIDIDACIKELENTSPDGDASLSTLSHEEAVGVCNNSIPYGGFYIDELISSFLLDSDLNSLETYIDSGVVKFKKDFTINVDGCVAYLSNKISKDGKVSDDELTYIVGICREELPAEGNLYLKDAIINVIISNQMSIDEVEKSGVIEQNNISKNKIMTKYTCDYKDIVIPEQTNLISGGVFNGKELTNVDFSKAKNLTIIGYGAFRTNRISNLDLSNLSKLKIIGGESFWKNEITNLKLPNNIKAIGMRAFRENKITNVDFSKLTNLTEMTVGVFENNEIINADLSDMNNLTTISTSAFDNNKINNLKLPNNSVKLIEIGQFAFSNNQLSGELDLSGLTNLDYISGFGHNQLTSVTLPNNIKTIGDAFYDNQLTSIEIPNSVTTIGDSSFYNNPNLTLIEIDKTENSISGSPWGASNATVTWLR